MKKYVLRFIAILPMLCVGLSSMFAFLYAIDHSSLFILLGIGNFLAFARLSHYYEEMVDELCDFLKDLCEKTYIYRKV